MGDVGGGDSWTGPSDVRAREGQTDSRREGKERRKSIKQFGREERVEDWRVEKGKIHDRKRASEAALVPGPGADVCTCARIARSALPSARRCTA